MFLFFFFFSSRRRHTRLVSDWSSDVCSSDLENQDQASFCPSAPREVSVLPELALGHLRYRLTGVPPQSNSPPGTVPGRSEERRVGKECRCGWSPYLEKKKHERHDRAV